MFKQKPPSLVNIPRGPLINRFTQQTIRKGREEATRGPRDNSYSPHLETNLGVVKRKKRKKKKKGRGELDSS